MKKSLLAIFVFCSLLSSAQKVRLVIPKGHTAAVSDAAIFGNNRYLISGARDNSVKIWDIKEQKEINSLIGEKGRDAFSYVGVSADEKYFFRGGSKEVSMWEMASQKLIFNKTDDNGFYKDFFAVPKSSFIYYRSSVGTKYWEIYKLNISTASTEKIFSTKDDCKFQKVLYAPDGSYLLYSPFDSYEKTDIVKISLPSGKKEKVISNLKSVEGIAMVNADKAAYWTAYGDYVFFNPNTGAELSRLKLKNFVEIKFSPDGNLMAVKEEFKSNSISFYNALSGEKLFSSTSYGHKITNNSSEQIISFKFSDDGKYVVSTGLDQQAMVWSSKSGIPVYATNEKMIASTNPNKALFSPNADYIMADDIANNSLINWNFDKSAPAYQIKNFVGGEDDLSFDISPDGKQLAARSKAYNINFYNTETGELKDLATDKVSGVHYLSNQKLIVRMLEENSDNKKFKELLIGTLSSQNVFASYETFFKDYVAVNNKNGQMARATYENAITVYNTQTGDMRRVEKDNGFLQWLCYNPAGTKLYASYEHKSKRGVQYTIIYDAATLKEIKKLDFAVNKFKLSKDERLMAGVSFKNEFEIEIYDLKTERLITTLKGHHSAIASINFSPDDKLLLSAANDHTVRIWSVADRKELASLVSFVNNDWAVVMPDGRFDASESAQKRMYFAAGIKQIPLANLYEKFYTPKLLARLIAGEKFDPLHIDINDIKAKPKVAIKYAEVKRNLEVADDIQIYGNTSGVAEITVNATAPEDKVDEIRLFHNGKAVNLATRGLFVTDNDGADSKKYTIHLLPGANNFKAVALNSQRTESEPDEIIVNYKKDGAAPAPIKPDNKNTAVIDNIDRSATLHIVVVGINAYKNKINPLAYAVPDATAFKTEFEKDAQSIIGNVKSYLITDDKASKIGIMTALGTIKKMAKPQDVFVFYYAGHGYIHPSNKEFYLVSSDVADGGESLLQNGISAKELQTVAVDIPAQKQLFIMDACQSAGAFEKMLQHDGEQQKNLAVIARSTGTHWMAASGSTETAKEFGDLGHGVFTYSLLEALKGKAATNKMITVNGLKNYLQQIVPELIKKYGGNSQYPASYGFGNDFPVEIIQ